MKNMRICWYCGCMGSDKSVVNKRFFHKDCFEKYKKEKESRLEKYVELKAGIMHERALRMLEKQGVDLECYYDESIAVYEKAIEEPNKFLSSHEMIAAMELLRHEIPFKKEYKILKHKVDFLIPSLKVVLEVDGHTHNYKRIADTQRDGNILNELNKDNNGWEVVRIPTKRIEQNIQKLVPAIKSIYKYKQHLRRKNNGLLPSNFSKRDREFYENALAK